MGRAAGGGAQGLGDVFKLIRPKGREASAKWERASICTVFKAVRMVPYPSGMSYLTPRATYMARRRIGGHSHIGCLLGCGTIYELSPTSDGRWHERVLHRFIDAFGEGAEPHKR